MSKSYKLIITFCVVSFLIATSAYGAARVSSDSFAILCSHGSLDEIQQALNSGSKPTEQVLITAAYSNPDPEVMKLLISSAQHYGLDLRRMSEITSGILNSAIRGGRPEVVRAILSFGINVNAKDRSRTSPMSEALRYGYKSEEEGRQEIIRILREAGAKR